MLRTIFYKPFSILVFIYSSFFLAAHVYAASISAVTTDKPDFLPVHEAFRSTFNQSGNQLKVQPLQH
jgi:hypothetical protein